MSVRITLACESGALPLPEGGRLRVYGATPDTDLSGFDPAAVEIIQPVRPDHDALRAAGFACHASDPGTPVDGALVVLPRAKAHAWLLIAAAATASTGWVAVDGAKTDGIDSVIKALRGCAAPGSAIAKAHGKLVVFDAASARIPTPAGPGDVGGMRTVPGVFSADGVDPASALLAQALPERIGARVADLGAGWGYLSAQILTRDSVASLDLIEADARALGCARHNVTDPRAAFHWADARNWRPQAPLDAVVMNPPFHSGRSGDPGLGRAFIATAAAALAPSGRLWLVANRHLPYEAEMAARFRVVEELGGTSAFKILLGERPSRQAR
ncbi:MAG: methyltransferase [Marinibacterium sp.]|nr:methyltransferase [Marinibacterium sp.]